MPWKEITVVKKRTEFVLLASKEGSSMSALRQRFGISRKMECQWLDRHDGFCRLAPGKKLFDSEHGCSPARKEGMQCAPAPKKSEAPSSTEL
jgi:hypothetical protein